jgi:hypothetical protein
MPTVIATHDVNDTAPALLAQPRGGLEADRVTNTRTFVNPRDRSSVGVIMNVLDIDAVTALMESDEGAPRWSTTGTSPRS